MLGAGTRGWQTPGPPLPRACCLPTVPCNRVRSCPRWRGTVRCPAAACGQGRRGMERRAGGRWGHTGHRPERTAHPGGTAVPGIPAGPGGVSTGRGRGFRHAAVPTGAEAHLVRVRPLEALAGELLARRGTRVGMLGHPLPTIQGAGAGRPRRAHAHRGDAGGSHDTRHASRAQAGWAAGSSMRQELAAEGLPCTHLQRGERVVTVGRGRPPASRLCRGRALTVPYWLSSWLCFSCSAATVAVAVAVAVAAAAATAAAAAAWVKSAGGRLACEGSPIPPGALGLPA